MTAHTQMRSWASQFVALDKPALNPLPVERFDLSQWSRARANIDYHIVFDTNYYSVPYNLVQELVEVRSTPTTVELFYNGQRAREPSRLRNSRWLIRSHSSRMARFSSSIEKNGRT
jgi:hypothetical protein